MGKHRKLLPTAAERLGAVICWENYMPLLRMSMYAKGIELWCAPTADARDTWVASMQHIACEGRCFVLSANQFARRSDYPEDYPIGRSRARSAWNGGVRQVESRDEPERVLDAFDRRRLIEPFSADPSFDEDRAYTTASEVDARRIERGERPVGRKIGFTNRTIWPQYGVWAPIRGHVYDSTTTYSSGGAARLTIGHLIQPRVEPEIQLHFARTPPVTRDEAAILECIDWIALGFEIVPCPFADWRFRAVSLTGTRLSTAAPR